jgi:hypothetical protein
MERKLRPIGTSRIKLTKVKETVANIIRPKVWAHYYQKSETNFFFSERKLYWGSPGLRRTTGRNIPVLYSAHWFFIHKTITNQLITT